jgi:ATP-binding cassette subfamily B protein
MFSLSWQITLISLVMLPLFVIPARRIGARLQSITRESYNLNASMNATMTERFNVAGALLVKLFGRPADEDASFRRRAARVRDIGVTSAMYGRAFFVALTLVASLAQALVYGLGGYYAVSGQLSAGTVVTLALLLTRLYGPLTALSNARVDLKPMVDDAPDAGDLPVDARSIEFADVRFSYPTADEVSLASLEDVAVLDATATQEVLRGVSFRAEPGELVALVGPSGAGKTTISQLVPRMYDVRAGQVLVGGHDVRTVTQQSLRDRIGVVSQEAHMFHDTIRGNLLYAKPSATEQQLWEAVDAAQIGELVRSLPDRLDTLVGDRGYRLSGGEKARLAIARLLLKAPAIVILDEATAHLDSESEAAVQEALAHALAGRTSLVIAHRLSTIHNADRILVVDDGRIVESGTHAELIDGDGLYAELYRTQFTETARA